MIGWERAGGKASLSRDVFNSMVLSFFLVVDILMNWRVHSKRKCGMLYCMVQFDHPFGCLYVFIEYTSKNVYLYCVYILIKNKSIFKIQSINETSFKTFCVSWYASLRSLTF